MEVNFKRCKYGDVKPYVYGLSSLRYQHKDWTIEYGGFLKHKFMVQHVYNSRRGYTYLIIVDRGFLDMFGVHESDDTIVLKVGGKHMDVGEFFDVPEFKAAVEELHDAYEKQIKETSEDEEP